MHPVYGVPQLHHDQINIVAKYLQDINEDINTQRFMSENDEVVPIVNKLTRKYSRKHSGNRAGGP